MRVIQAILVFALFGGWAASGRAADLVVIASDACGPMPRARRPAPNACDKFPSSAYVRHTVGPNSLAGNLKPGSGGLHLSRGRVPCALRVPYCV